MFKKNQQGGKSVLVMEGYVKTALVMTAVLVLIMAESAFAQGGANSYVSKVLATGWLKNLITGGFALATMLQIFDKWKPIFEGTDVLKNLSVVGAFVFITVFWAEILEAIIKPT
jgi:hypothetical protein